MHRHKGKNRKSEHKELYQEGRSNDVGVKAEENIISEYYRKKKRTHSIKQTHEQMNVSVLFKKLRCKSLIPYC